jgi:hypothetical protein
LALAFGFLIGTSLQNFLKYNERKDNFEYRDRDESTTKAITGHEETSMVDYAQTSGVRWRTVVELAGS